MPARHLHAVPRWDVTDRPEVTSVATRTAGRLARQLHLDAADLTQEALIRIATAADLLECIDGDNLGLLAHRLRCDLLDIARAELVVRDRLESYDLRVDPDDEREPAGVSLPQRLDSPTYTPELVEALLPAVWDDTYCWGIRVENAPDADMPRGTTNKATGNTLAAHIADIKTGWATAPLRLDERRTLLLRYGLDLPGVESAAILDVAEQRVSDWTGTGVRKIATTLNGITNLSEFKAEKRPTRSDTYFDGASATAA